MKKITIKHILFALLALGMFCIYGAFALSINTQYSASIDFVADNSKAINLLAFGEIIAFPAIVALFIINLKSTK